MDTAFTQHGDKEVGRAIEHSRCPAPAVGGCDVPLDTQERSEPIKATKGGADLREYVERSKASGSIALVFG